MKGQNHIQPRFRWCRLLAMAVLFFGGTAMGQTPMRVYAGIAFNGGYMPVDSLNWIIDQYNMRQGDVVKPLGNINAPMGVSGQLGIVANRLVIDLGSTTRMAGTRSRENEFADGTYFVRQLRFRANTFDVGAGGMMIEKPNGNLIMGASLDFGAVRVFTRYARNDQVNSIPLTSPVVNELTLGTTVYLQGMINIGLNNPLYLYIRPYFQYAWNRNDFQPVNRNINFQTYLDDPQFILSFPHNVGFKIGIAFYSG